MNKYELLAQLKSEELRPAQETEPGYYFVYIDEDGNRSSLWITDLEKLTSSKAIDEKRAKAEGFVLNVLCSPSLGTKPKPYIESMIRTISIALSESDTMGFAVQLAEIHPELAQAVSDFHNGRIGRDTCKQKPAIDTGIHSR